MERPHFEYLVKKLDIQVCSVLEEQLDELGKDGWELVIVIDGTWIFKAQREW
jgi:hypothetical protein